MIWSAQGRYWWLLPAPAHPHVSALQTSSALSTTVAPAAIGIVSRPNPDSCIRLHQYTMSTGNEFANGARGQANPLLVVFDLGDTDQHRHIPR